jgi:hypothetical protein
LRPKIELVFFEGCPHVEDARRALREALALASAELAWREFRSDDPALPAYAKGYGSPSIFVNGREVTGETAGATSNACRVYGSAALGLRGAPSAEALALAIGAAGR